MLVRKSSLANNYKGSQREQDEALVGQLDMERDSFKPQWQELGDNILPTRPRFYTSDINKGGRKNTRIIDSTATQSAGTLAAGMMSGVTSPARPWFRLSVPDPQLAEVGSVKKWLYQVGNIMNTTYLKSNLYNILPTTYGDLGVFGTAAMSVEEDLSGNVFHCQSFPIGSYSIGKDYRGRINIFSRKFKMTVRQLVDQFGLENCSTKVQKFWTEGKQTEQWIEVRHLIKPNNDWNPNKLESKYKKFKSCYYECDAGAQGQDKEKYLRESGYDYFPVLVPRWQVTGEDVYATSCPGMVCLGDIKQLQLGEKRTLEAIDKIIRPPLIGPSVLKNQSGSIVPGGITYSDQRDASNGLRPIYEVNYRIQEMEQKNEQVRTRVKECFFTNMFINYINNQRSGTTAREVDEAHEEKLLMLGPVLEQLNQDLLDPLIDLTFNYHMSQGLLPPPPPELEGIDLKVEYISIMAQAQKMIGISTTERFVGFMGQLMTMDPGIKHKWNIDQTVDHYGDSLSIPPDLIFTDEEAAASRAAEAQAQQQAQTMEMLQQGAGIAKDMAGANMEGDNALNRIVKSVAG